MTRGEHERGEAYARESTVSRMRAAGYWSAEREDLPGAWQTFAIPPEADRPGHELVLAQFRPPQAKRDLRPQRYGEAG